MKKTFVATLCEEAAINKDLVLITGDLGFGVLTPFWEKFPAQFLNAGISEQNMTAMAAGLAMEGKVVFTYSIGNFPTLRCLEQVRNDVCYHDANVNIVAVGGGMGYGPMGMTHHATEDVAMMRALPGMRVFTPADAAEAVCATRTAAAIEGPVYLRLGSGGEVDLHTSVLDAIIGEAFSLAPGSDAAIFAAGPIVSEALQASKVLARKGIGCAVYSVPSVKPLDEKTLCTVASGVKRIYTAEEHNVIGGLGGAVAEVLAGVGAAVPLHRFGLQDVFTSAVGKQQYLRAVYGIDAVGMAARISADFDA